MEVINKVSVEELNENELLIIVGGATGPSGVLQWVGYYAHAVYNALKTDDYYLYM